MAKHRRKQANGMPAKGRLRDIADALWSLAVRSKWKNRCAVCGKGKVEAHHLVPRQHTATRYDLRNGVALCSHHHQFDPDVSPHQNAAGWLGWLGTHHEELATWYTANPRPRFEGTTNAQWYMDQIRNLRQHVEPDDFSRIVGKRFAAFLEE